jgi:hypothetical protein
LLRKAGHDTPSDAAGRRWKEHPPSPQKVVRLLAGVAESLQGNRARAAVLRG